MGIIVASAAMIALAFAILIAAYTWPVGRRVDRGGFQ